MMARSNQGGSGVILVVDVGNSVTNLGLAYEGDLLSAWSVTTPDRLTADEALLCVTSFFAGPGLRCEGVRRHRVLRCPRAYRRLGRSFACPLRHTSVGGGAGFEIRFEAASEQPGGFRRRSCGGLRCRKTALRVPAHRRRLRDGNHA